MAGFATKYFGEIIIGVDGGDGDTYVKYNNQEIHIFFYKYNDYGDKIKLCLEIMDKYAKINEISKR